MFYFQSSASQHLFLHTLVFLNNQFNFATSSLIQYHISNNMGDPHWDTFGHEDDAPGDAIFSQAQQLLR